MAAYLAGVMGTPLWCFSSIPGIPDCILNVVFSWLLPFSSNHQSHYVEHDIVFPKAGVIHDRDSSAQFHLRSVPFTQCWLMRKLQGYGNFVGEFRDKSNNGEESCNSDDEVFFGPEELEGEEKDFYQEYPIRFPWDTVINSIFENLLPR